MQVRTGRSDVLWNYAGTIVSMASNFVLLPFLVAWLSEEELGLWYVFAAAGGLVMLFEFGFSPTFARNFAFCWAGARRLVREGSDPELGEGVDPVLTARLIGACRMVYRVVALVALVALAVPGTLYVRQVASGLDLGEAFVAWGVYGPSVLVNLYYLHYTAMLRGIGAVAADNRMKVAARLAQLVLSVALLACGCGLVGAAVGFAANALVYRLLGARAFWHDPRVAALGLADVPVSRAEAFEVCRVVAHNAWRDGLVQLANYASTQATTLLCTSFLGLAQAGAYSVALQLATAVGNLALAVSVAYRPMMQGAFQRGDLALIRQAVGKGAVAYLAVFAAGVAAVLALAYPVLALVRPGTSFDPIVFCAVASYLLLFDWHSLFASTLCSMNRIPYVWPYVVSAACGVALTALLVARAGLGVWGLVLGSALPQLAYNDWKWPRAAARAVGSTVPSLCREGLSLWAGRLRGGGRG